MSVLITILKRHLPHISDVHPADQDGFRLMPNEVTAEQLRAELAQVLEQNKWIATCIVRGCLLIEPHYTSEVKIDCSNCLYHVSDAGNREQIRVEGLSPRQGGNTRMNRTYPPRVFLSLNLPAAFEFIDFQCREKRNPFTKAVEHPAKDPSRLDVWKVLVPEDVELFRDVLFAGKAVWTEAAIPADRVMLYENWPERKAEWADLRKQGVF